MRLIVMMIAIFGLLAGMNFMERKTLFFNKEHASTPTDANKNSKTIIAKARHLVTYNPTGNEASERYLSGMMDDYEDMGKALENEDAAIVVKNAKQFLCTVNGFENWRLQQKKKSFLHPLSQPKAALEKIVNTTNTKKQREYFLQLSGYLQLLKEDLGKKAIE